MKSNLGNNLSLYPPVRKLAGAECIAFLSGVNYYTGLIFSHVS